MHKLQVILEDWQYEALNEEAQRTGKSLSELIRDIVCEYLRRTSDKSGLNDAATDNPALKRP